jgi:hypothetical protein
LLRLFEQIIDSPTFLPLPANQTLFLKELEFLADCPFAYTRNFAYGPVGWETGLCLSIGEEGQDVIDGDAGRRETFGMGSKDLLIDPIPAATGNLPDGGGVFVRLVDEIPQMRAYMFHTIFMLMFIAQN